MNIGTIRSALRYSKNLADPVAPGAGCHGWLLSTANLAKLAGIPQEQCFVALRQAIPAGVRRVFDKEITDAIKKAYDSAFTPSARPKPLIADGNTARQKIIEAGRFSTSQELVAASPIPIPTEPDAQQRLFFETMFEWNNFVFCGDRLEPGTTKAIQPACFWVEHGAAGPFVIVNPLSGCPKPKKDGSGETYRGDGCVQVYRHCLVEFDNVPLKDQASFWSGAKLPVKALVYSGGKSIHAWLDISDQNIRTSEQWDLLIKAELYQKRLIPLGVDPACANAARLSRLPGVFRQEKKQWQRLLWLAERGQNV